MFAAITVSTGFKLRKRHIVKLCNYAYVLDRPSCLFSMFGSTTTARGINSMIQALKTITCITIFALYSVHAASQAVSIRSDEWFPINGPPGDEPPGFQIELAEKVFDQVDYRLMPWGRAVEEVEDGKFDCVVGSYIDDTPGFILPTENWGMDQTGVFVRDEDNWKYTAPETLLSRKVGVIRGYDYDEAINDYIKNRKDVFKSLGGNDALSKNILKLNAKRIDTVIESVPVMQAKIREMNLEGEFILAGALTEPQPLYIACSPNNPKSKQLIEMVDKKTKELRASGELERIMQKYGLSDWK